MNEEKVLHTLGMLSTNFQRLRYPRLRRAMGRCVTVEQAAVHPSIRDKVFQKTFAATG